MEKRRQSPDEAVMTYYHDKLQLCLQADPNMSSTMLVHHLTKGLNNSLVPHVIRRHPATPADFLKIAQDEEKIQITLNELRHSSINSPDIYPHDDDDHIDRMVSLVKRSTNPTTRSSNWQPSSPSPQPLMNSIPANKYTPPPNHRYYHQSSSSSIHSYQCYVCHRFGHLAKQCPHRKNI